MGQITAAVLLKLYTHGNKRCQIFISLAHGRTFFQCKQRTRHFVLKDVVKFRDHL